jgi:hypothetical protein
MTIALGVACPEGLVLAADSRSSVLSQNKFRIATDYADKLFSLSDKFAAVTFGWANLEGKTIAGQIAEFVAQTKMPDNIDDTANELCRFMKARIDAHIAAGRDPMPSYDTLGFVVGGFDASGVGHLKAVWLPSATIVPGAMTNAPGAMWYGETDVINRLYWGYDVHRVDASKWAKRNRDALEKLSYSVQFQWFALQDAVDFATFVVCTTIDTQRFTDGTSGNPGGSPTCGGPVQVVALTARGGIDWIQRTTLRGDGRPPRAEGFAAE